MPRLAAAVLFLALSACGPEVLPPAPSCDPCAPVTPSAINCDQTPPPAGCSPSEPTDDPPPPPPPPMLAPTSGVYEGYATIIDHVGPVVSGCWPVYGKLFVRLTFGAAGPDDGTGAVTVTSNVASDYRFTSVASQLGGSTPEEREDRSYALAFSPDMLRLTGRVLYVRNAQATNRSQCSGYVFNVAYSR